MEIRVKHVHRETVVVKPLVVVHEERIRERIVAAPRIIDGPSTVPVVPLVARTIRFKASRPVVRTTQHGELLWQGIGIVAQVRREQIANAREGRRARHAGQLFGDGQLAFVFIGIAAHGNAQLFQVADARDAFRLGL